MVYFSPWRGKVNTKLLLRTLNTVSDIPAPAELSRGHAQMHKFAIKAMLERLAVAKYILLLFQILHIFRALAH